MRVKSEYQCSIFVGERLFIRSSGETEYIARQNAAKGMMKEIKNQVCDENVIKTPLASLGPRRSLNFYGNPKGSLIVL